MLLLQYLQNSCFSSKAPVILLIKCPEIHTLVWFIRLPPNSWFGNRNWEDFAYRSMESRFTQDLMDNNWYFQVPCTFAIFIQYYIWYLRKKNSALGWSLPKSDTALDGYLPTHCIKMTQKAVLSWIASMAYRIWLHMEILHHQNLRVVCTTPQRMGK